MPIRRKRRRIRWDRLFLLIVVLAVLGAALVFAARGVYDAAAAGYAGVTGAFRQAGDKVRAEKDSAERAYHTIFNKNMNILLLGTEMASAGGAGRQSDAVVLVSIDGDTGVTRLLSLPGDTLVTIPGREGPDKLKNAYAYGGPELSRRVAEDLLQTPIQYYIAMDEAAFIKMIDSMGGLDLYVEADMDYQDPGGGRPIHLRQGYQRLDGSKADQYVRYCSDDLGDIGRMQRQQRFLAAFSQEFFNMGLIVQLPELKEAVSQSVETDMTAISFMMLIRNLHGLRPTVLRSEMLPGRPATLDHTAYWLPDVQKVR